MMLEYSPGKPSCMLGNETICTMSIWEAGNAARDVYASIIRPIFSV